MPHADDRQAARTRAVLGGDQRGGVELEALARVGRQVGRGDQLDQERHGAGSAQHDRAGLARPGGTREPCRAQADDPRDQGASGLLASRPQISLGISWYSGKRPVSSLENTFFPSTVTSNAPPCERTSSIFVAGKALVSSAARPAAWGS